MKMNCAGITEVSENGTVGKSVEAFGVGVPGAFQVLCKQKKLI